MGGLPLNITTALAILGFIGAIMAWNSGLESRVAIAETKLIGAEAQINRIDGQLGRIESKIDRLIERIGK
jgi:hypothetical protein